MAPCDPYASAIVVRMLALGNYQQMPPLGSEIPHEAGLSAVSDWILALEPAASP